jgi:hypothetical protein
LCTELFIFTEARYFAPVFAHPNFVACFGGEFTKVEVPWLISALYGFGVPISASLTILTIHFMFMPLLRVAPNFRLIIRR